MSTAYPTVRHRCDFCRRSYAAKGAAVKHEAQCFRNPASAACPSCVHYKGIYDGCVLGLGHFTRPDRYDEEGTFEWEIDCPSHRPASPVEAKP